MSNHVRNIVKMKGITSLPIFTDKDGSDFQTVSEFDFNKIIPMPESLNIESSSTDLITTDVAVEVAIRRAASASRQCSGPRIIPGMTDFKYERHLNWCGKTEDELCELGAKYLHNMIFHGATSWYEWRIAHWGTKWNSYENVRVDSNTIMFNTAYNAPEPVIAHLAKMYPEVEIEHWWADEAIGYNTGYTKYSGGEAATISHYDKHTNEAYATYVRCWGDSQCLYRDENGIWHLHDCGECHGCD